MTDYKELVAEAKVVADDPMWAHHVEVSKKFILSLAEAIERLSADRDEWKNTADGLNADLTLLGQELAALKKQIAEAEPIGEFRMHNGKDPVVHFYGDKTIESLQGSKFYLNPAPAPQEDAKELAKGCHRSHPHENMSPECERKAIEARAANAAAQEDAKDAARYRWLRTTFPLMISEEEIDAEMKEANNAKP